MTPKPWHLAVAALFTGLLYAVVFTRFGVFLVFDVLGDVASDALPLAFDDGPLRATYRASASERHDLPNVVEQPSGIFRGADELLVSTDQAELFILSDNYRLKHQQNLIGGPLLARQGALEAITMTETGLIAVGELGIIAVWEPGSWARLANKPLPKGVADFEYTGVTRLDDALYATTDGQTSIVNLTTGKISPIHFGQFLKDGRSASELVFSGISGYESRLYLVTENFTSIVVVDPSTMAAIEVVDIDDIEASDISIANGRAYISVDHNLFDPRPPLHVYDLNR